jgi:short-subunit dehydrogenase involved in D-alanine esterification of teichoic acids
MKMTGNTILVTGGTSGIGLGLALRFYQAGNKVDRSFTSAASPGQLGRAIRRQPAHAFSPGVSCGGLS